MSHRGMAIIDVISPCVTFNNNEESFKSLQYVKNNDIELHALDYIPHFNPIDEIEYHLEDIKKLNYTMVYI